jgi:hypothetical protein
MRDQLRGGSVRHFAKKMEMTDRDGTGWLGTQDSNSRMSFSKTGEGNTLVLVSLLIAAYKAPCERRVNHTANAKNWRARRDSNS